MVSDAGRDGPNGSRSGRPGPSWHSVRARIEDPASRPVTLLLLVACAVLIVVLGAWLLILRGLPSDVEIEDSRFATASVVLSRDGVEISRYQDRNRTWVPIAEISPNVIDALVAVEDHRFFSHGGIDVRRTAGSIVQTISGNAQGGSTITMQLARNAFPSLADDLTPARKIREWILAIELEGRYTKEEILEMYLNTVPFMYNAFGIEAAAQTYFQKSAIDLDLSESATLVAMLRGTSYYNPVRHPDRSHERRNVVLAQMVKHDYLEEDRFIDLRDHETELDFQRIRHYDNLAPYFSEYLRVRLTDWAEQNGYSLYTDGLRIHTTIDFELQQAAQDAIAQIGDDLQAVADVEWSAASPPRLGSDAEAYRNVRPNVIPFEYFWEQNGAALDDFLAQTRRFEIMLDEGLDRERALDSLRRSPAVVDSVKAIYQQLQAAFVAIEPSTGHVKAWVGGRDFEITQFDNVAQARRQPGSTFKPFVYATALEQGYRSTHMVRDRAVDFVDPQTGRRWSPQNVGTISNELMTLAEGLIHSKNTISAQVTIGVGADRVADTAHRMGIESELLPYPSLGLGTSEVSLLELTAAYATIADLGVYHEPVVIDRIEDRAGRLIEHLEEQETRRAISPGVAYELAVMMQGVISRGTGVRMRSYGAGGGVAGKTGTSQHGADGWFMLMHPDLVVGSWVGFNLPSITFRNDYFGQGSRTALPIVGEFYENVANSDSDVFGGPAWTAPPGYLPPPSANARLTAFDDRWLDGLVDSLRTVSGSQAAHGEFGVDPGPRTPDQLAADSLNRRERGLDPAPVDVPSANDDDAAERRGW